MGVGQVGFELLCLLAFGLSEAQWQGRSAGYQYPNMFGPRALARVPQKVGSRIPQFPEQSNPSSAVFAPPKLPSQYPVQTPAKTDFRGPAQDPMGVQLKELLDGPLTPLAWSFPSLPVEPQQPNIPFELRHPLPANSVAAQCGESSVHVEVMKDFFGTGMPLSSSAFSIGGCGPIGEDSSTQVLVFESELHACGSTSVMTENELVYMFSLLYTPEEVVHGVPIVRSTGAVIGIECHYPRVQNVSSSGLLPAWVPYVNTIVAEELLVFSLRLMSDDWKFERPSNQYFLGDFINVEASVRTYNHIPLRVFVESCVATSVPDVSAVPRYSFIENNGCLVDAKLTGSGSRFMPRTQNDKLQFQLETFRFQQELSGFVYIACVLEVAAASTPTNVAQKACSFSSNGWVSADEDNLVCGCCDTTCGVQTASDQFIKDATRWDTTFVGPISVKDTGYGPM